jgi:hypothetical protein
MGKTLVVNTGGSTRPYLKKGKLRFRSCSFIQAVFIDLATGTRTRRSEEKQRRSRGVLVSAELREGGRESDAISFRSYYELQSSF